MTTKATDAATAAVEAAAEAASAAVDKAADTETKADIVAAQTAIAELTEKVSWLETQTKKAPETTASELQAITAEAKSLVAELRQIIADLKPSTLAKSKPDLPLSENTGDEPPPSPPPQAMVAADLETSDPPTPLPRTDTTRTGRRESVGNTRNAGQERQGRKVRLL